ncbi:hypothetical protein EG68_10114 [Paragonimus skrjabini miyazakii]|uniref:Mitochondrial assembly of ribosomal large subunit protein 1 n=1 Tax=Paragonimus skrjabini miyazakii TaxID=59628 RepID=A0A8S9YG38_9TREM|nr:hypothetical protein EG68_10114 [Paragonimus skrjabini miyazakii]
MATCRRIFRHLIRAPFGVHHSYYPLVARRLGSKTDGGGPSENNIPDDLFEIQDVPFEKQWEENPEFDYTSLISIPSSYDFISSQADEVVLFNEERLEAALCTLEVQNTFISGFQWVAFIFLKYKRRNSSVKLPRVEGLDGSCEWIAINMGNILLHLFLPSVRAHYDLEALWAAGPEFDEITHGVVCPPANTTNENAVGSVDWDQLVREVQQKQVQQTVCEDSHSNNTF